MHASDELRELYRELIIDHARNPRHFGELQDATHAGRGINPLCGDALHLYLCVDRQERIVDVSFQGSGCAISMASASMLGDAIIGLKTTAALRLFAIVSAQLTGCNSAETSEFDLDKIRALYGVREFPSRVKCAMLSWHALNAALHRQSTPASTE